MTLTLAELLKDSAYKLSQFKPERIQVLESAMTLKDSGPKTAPSGRSSEQRRPNRFGRDRQRRHDLVHHQPQHLDQHPRLVEPDRRR